MVRKVFQRVSGYVGLQYRGLAGVNTYVNYINYIVILEGTGGIGNTVWYCITKTQWYCVLNIIILNTFILDHIRYHIIIYNM